MIFDSIGNLYGVASGGGANGSGVAFELSGMGGIWTETVLYSFCSQFDCTDGATPETGLVMDDAGNLYEATDYYGIAGVTFELSPFGGGWTEQVIYNRGATGIAMDAAGNIFGAGIATIFELSPDGQSGWNLEVLHTFTGAPKDGAYPNGAPVLDEKGNLYGTTYFGGIDNVGTVYKLSSIKTGKKRERGS